MAERSLSRAPYLLVLLPYTQLWRRALDTLTLVILREFFLLQLRFSISSFFHSATSFFFAVPSMAAFLRTIASFKVFSLAPKPADKTNLGFSSLGAMGVFLCTKRIEFVVGNFVSSIATSFSSYSVGFLLPIFDSSVANVSVSVRRAF